MTYGDFGVEGRLATFTWPPAILLGRILVPLNAGRFAGGGSMVYYERPPQIAPAVQGLLIGTVRELTPTAFLQTGGRREVD